MAFTPALVFAFLLAPAQDFLADGLKALDSKQPALAEPLLRKAVEADPQDYAAHFNLALALSLQQKDAEAVWELRRTLEIKPALYEADLNLGILLIRDNKPAEALPVLKEAVTAKPAETRPNLYYAQALLETGDAAEAERRYTTALAATPSLAPAQLGLGRALLAQSKFQEAAARFRTAGSKDGLLEVAAACEKAGLLPDAIAIYKGFPDDPKVREHLGRLQLDNSQAADAIRNLEESVRRDPRTANRLALADAYNLDKQPLKALEQLQLGVAGDPDNYDLRMSLGRTLRDLHKLLPASQQFAAAAKLRPDSVPAWNELASALIIGENYADGLAALDRIRALGKEIPGDFFLRAITLDKLKQRPQAIAAYRQFLEADNNAHPDQDFQSRARIRIIESELSRK